MGGSLPPGVDADIYAQLIDRIQQAGAHAILDSSGEALLQGCKACPTLVKPNSGRSVTAAWHCPGRLVEIP